MPIYKTDEKKNGVYKYKVRVNYVDANGKGRQLTRVVWGSAEAKELERQLTDEVNNKQLSNSSLTVQQLFVDFFKSIKHTTRATTIQGYEKNYRLHIKPYIDNVQLKRLNTKNLTDWKNQVNEKGLSLVTRKNIYATLRAALNFAVKMDMLPVSPLDKVDNFKDSYYQAQEIDFYTPEEFQLYKSAALDNAKKIDYYDYYIFFCLAYYTGARKGEIHALRWNRLDGKTLSIKKSISQKLKGGDVETPPKNKSSIRTIQMPLPLINILDEHKARQQQAIPNWNDNGFICGYYRPLRDTSIENENQRNATAANIKKIRIHDFRHSHASLLINNGVNIMEVARRLGHSTIKETMNTYAHLFPNEESHAISVLNNIK